MQQLTKEINMEKTKTQPKKREGVPMAFYSLDAQSEHGKQFKRVLEQGIDADNKAYSLLKEYGATGRIPEMYADFGGIYAFVFDDEPDKNLFRAIGEKSTDGDTLYIPNVQAEDNVCLWEKADELTGDNLIKSSKPFTATQAMMLVGRKKVGLAVGMELKYTSPAELLNLLGVKKEDIDLYINNKVSMQDLLKNRLFVSRRDKAYRTLAIGADKETHQFEQAIEGKQFCVYTVAKGTDEAVALFFKTRQLPLIPQGALNQAAGIGDNSVRCAFFGLDGKFYIASRFTSSLTETDGMTNITKEDYMTALEEAKVKYEQAKKSHNNNITK